MLWNPFRTFTKKGREAIVREKQEYEKSQICPMCHSKNWHRDSEDIDNTTSDYVIYYKTWLKCDDCGHYWSISGNFL